MLIAILPLPNGKMKAYRRESSGDFDSVYMDWQLDCLVARFADLGLQSARILDSTRSLQWQFPSPCKLER